MSTANDLREVASSCGTSQCTHLDWRIAHSFMNHGDYDTRVSQDDTQWWTFVLIVACALDGGNRGTCEWAYDDDEYFWNTQCGEAFQFTTDGPKENKMAYCCYCGGKIKETT